MDGVLVVDKPAGPTSHDVVDAARRALRTRRVGHTGTLDPFATGVLVLCVGRATRLARFLTAGDKEYRARVRLGFATSTDDATGEPLAPAAAVAPDEGAVRAAVASLVGQYDQVPPSFSARHVAGRRLYELARRGEAVARQATPVTVHELELVELAGSSLVLQVRCSPGTYVRAIARDLGERLGTGAHLTELRRTRSGEFSLAHAVAVHDLAAAHSRLIPLGELLPALPAVLTTDEGRRAVSHGRALGARELVSPFPAASVERVRVLDSSGELIALAVRGPEDPGGLLAAPPLLHPDLVLIDGSGTR